MFNRTTARVMAPSIVLVAVAGLSTPEVAQAGDVDLELRPVAAYGSTGEEVRVGLYAVDATEDHQPICCMQVMLTWDPAFLQLLAIDDTGGLADAASVLFSGFPIGAFDPDVVNESNPPQDGDGFYYLLGPLSSGDSPVVATAAGALITSFRFEVLDQNGVTPIVIMPEVVAGSPFSETIIFDGTAGMPNHNITGALGATDLRVGCPADTDGNGTVDVDDLLAIILNWGGTGTAGTDVTNDGVVNVDDLIATILRWGSCS